MTTAPTELPASDVGTFLAAPDWRATAAAAVGRRFDAAGLDYAP